MFGLAGGVPRQLTRRDARFPVSMTAVALDRAARNLAFLSGGTLQLADLTTGEKRLLGTFSTSEGPILRLTTDGRLLAMGDSVRRSVWIFDLTVPTATTTPRPPTPTVESRQRSPRARRRRRLPRRHGSSLGRPLVGGPRQPGANAVVVPSPEPDSPAPVSQLFLWDREADTWRALTAFASSSLGAALPRLDEAGRRLAFVAWAPFDGTPQRYPDARARLVVADLDADGGLGAGQVEQPFDGTPLEVALGSDGSTVWLRRIFEGHEALTRVDVETGLAEELVKPATALSAIDLSGDGARALVRRVTPSGDVLFARVSVGGLEPETPIAWAGALDQRGARIAALVAPVNGGEERRQLGALTSPPARSSWCPTPSPRSARPGWAPPAPSSPPMGAGPPTSTARPSSSWTSRPARASPSTTTSPSL